MMSEIKKNFGFGCMRLPMENGEVNQKVFNAMVDEFMNNGFNYFDTAHVYLGGKSEPALSEGLVRRYPRDSYVLTTKLTQHCFNKEEDIRPLFERQLEACGVDYFDYYLMHAQSEDIYAKFKRCRGYEISRQLKSEGKFKHFGISFHDKASVLDKILNENPDIEVVQIQLNYMDFEDPAVQSKACYEVCRKHGKKVIVMEPLKGGNLINLPDEAKAVFDELDCGSYASYALRFAAGFEDIIMVLSGMSNMEDMKDNIATMKEFVPLSEKEMNAVNQVCDIFGKMNLIPCTACRYCTDGCPKNIDIPNLFACMNAKEMYNNWNTDYYYNNVYTINNGKASECIKCGKCEFVCPQHLKISELMTQVADAFE